VSWWRAGGGVNGRETAFRRQAIAAGGGGYDALVGVGRCALAAQDWTAARLHFERAAALLRAAAADCDEVTVRPAPDATRPGAVRAQPRERAARARCGED
jgi:hypothetical protein